MNDVILLTSQSESRKIYTDKVKSEWKKKKWKKRIFNYSLVINQLYRHQKKLMILQKTKFKENKKNACQ